MVAGINKLLWWSSVSNPSDRSHRGAWVQHRCPSKARSAIIQHRTHRRSRTGRCLENAGIKRFDWYRRAKKNKEKSFANPIAPGVMIRIITACASTQRTLRGTQLMSSRLFNLFCIETLNSIESHEPPTRGEHTDVFEKKNVPTTV